VTGSAAFIVGSGAGGNEMAGCDNEWTGCDNADSISRKVQIEGITTGVVVDYGIKDAMNMGAAMAPAACELIVNHLSDFGRKASYYDRIVTGDLGSVGQKILIDLCRQKGVDISKNHEDCGMKMFDATNQNTGSGGSGCACSATVLAAYYLPKLRSGELKRILFVPTGALLSPVSFNEGESVPGIAHGVVLGAVM
jgi:stage V sporulation protein AD